MPIPKPREKMTDYEKVNPDEWLPGVIEKVQYEEKRPFTWEGKTKEQEAVRFKFKLDDYQYPHYSRWMKFNYSEKSNLYSKYLVNLVENPTEDMMFDTDNLAGMRVKLMFSQNGEYQNIEQIRAVDPKKKI